MDVMSEMQDVKDKNGLFFCIEQWEDALKIEFRRLGWNLDGIIFILDKCSVSPIEGDLRAISYIPTPKAIKEWIANNPKPQMSRNDLILHLAKRVETLETALAEKGEAR